MLGSADIKVRPLKLALMVDPNSAPQVREAIRLASTQWGGMFFPIIPVHKRMPTSWRDGPLKSPPAQSVVKGYLDGFDPDILVQFGQELPKYVLDLKLNVLKPDDFWSSGLDKNTNEPVYGIGVLDVLLDIYREHFKFKAKYPLKAIVPVIPWAFGLFWASVFGEYPVHIAEAIDKEFGDALDLSKPEVRADKFRELTNGDVLFPRRITQWATRVQGGVGFRGNASVFLWTPRRSRTSSTIGTSGPQAVRCFRCRNSCSRMSYSNRLLLSISTSIVVLGGRTTVASMSPAWFEAATAQWTRCRRSRSPWRCHRRMASRGRRRNVCPFSIGIQDCGMNGLVARMAAWPTCMVRMTKPSTSRDRRTSRFGSSL